MSPELAAEVTRAMLRVERLMLRSRATGFDLQDALKQVERMMSKMGQTLDELKAVAAQQKTLNASVSALFAELHRRLQEAIDTGEIGEIQKVVDELEGDQAALGDAITANTPAAPPVPPAPNP